MAGENHSSCWLVRQPDEDAPAAFLRWHTKLFREQLLPVAAFGGKRRAPDRSFQRQLLGEKTMYNPFRDSVNKITVRALSRLAFVKFLGQQMLRIAPVVTEAARIDNRTTRCLEWDGPWYLAQYRRACDTTWTFSFNKRPGKLPDHHVLFGDLLRVAEQHRDMVGTFDIIFCNQVFEHVQEPHLAAASVAALLRPGGYLIWTAPFLEPTHGVPYDYFRFTVEGGATLLRGAGLDVLDLAKGGDSGLTSAYLLGYAAGELDKEALAAQLVEPTTSAQLNWASKNNSQAALQHKLYYSACVLAQAPAGRTKYRVVWTRSMVPVDHS